MDLEALYEILVAVARQQRHFTYTDLSTAYHAATGDWHEPHGSWDAPLGEINIATHSAGLPALSAVVVLKETGEPGGLFWGSSPNVPPKPRGQVDRIALYGQILGRVHAAEWPDSLPG